MDAVLEGLIAALPPGSAAQTMHKQQLKFAKDHTAVIKRFGRYPHRNKVPHTPPSSEQWRMPHAQPPHANPSIVCREMGAD